MKVMLVSHHYPPDGAAGVERVVEALGFELRARGDQVSVVSRRLGEPGQKPRTMRELLRDGTLHYRLSGGERTVEHFLAHHERLEQLFTQALVEAQPDVVHIHHLLGLSPRFVELAHRLGAAVVVSFHDYYFACPQIILQKPSGELCEGPRGGLECAQTCFAHESQAVLRWGLRTAYFRKVLEAADRFISPSRHMASFFEAFGTDPSRVHVVDNGVSIEPLGAEYGGRSTPSSRGSLNVAYLGTVAPHKGVHIIVDALRTAGVPAAELVVGGFLADPDYARRLRESAAAVPGLTLRLYGTYEMQELPLLLRDVDCLVIPSQWQETFAIVAREAFVRGVPILSARIGGLKEAVTEGFNGFSFAADSPEQLGGLLRRLAEDEELLLRLREGARATPVTPTSAHADAVRAVYEEAIDGRARTNGTVPGTVEELHFLESGLVAAGFADEACS